jgi:mRNA interferase MazF
VAFAPMRGEIWYADLSPVVGHEQHGKRPVLIVSVNQFNQSAADLIIIAPLTSKEKHIRSHVEIRPPEGGLAMRSFVMCEAVRSISKQRLINGPLGIVSVATLDKVVDRIGTLIGI